MIPTFTISTVTASLILPQRKENTSFIGRETCFGQAKSQTDFLRNDVKSISFIVFPEQTLRAGKYAVHLGGQKGNHFPVRKENERLSCGSLCQPALSGTRQETIHFSGDQSVPEPQAIPLGPVGPNVLEDIMPKCVISTPMPSQPSQLSAICHSRGTPEPECVLIRLQLLPRFKLRLNASTLLVEPVPQNSNSFISQGHFFPSSLSCCAGTGRTCQGAGITTFCSYHHTGGIMQAMTWQPHLLQAELTPP